MAERILDLQLGGAARLKIMPADGGELMSFFGAPGRNTISLPDTVGFEQVVVTVEPLGGRPWTEVINFGGGPQAHVMTEEDGSRLGSFAAQEAPPGFGDLPIATPPPPVPAPPPPASTPLSPFFWAKETPSGNPGGLSTPAPESARLESPPAVRTRAFAVGIATDGKPFDYGGWRAFDGPWDLQVSDVDGRIRIDIPRGEQAMFVPPEGGFRLRGTLTVEQTFVERFLLPVYGGGVRVEIAAPGGEDAPHYTVRPIDPDRYGLQQALEAGTEAEGQMIWDRFTAAHDVERFVFDDSLDDPWTVLLLLLANDRFRSVSLTRPEVWCETMAQRFGWISDFLILQARNCLKDPSREAGVARAFGLLRKARHVGAPYFAASNRMLMGMLSGLAGSESSKATAEAAQREMAQWWRRLDNQNAAGVMFCWRMDNGHNSRGTLDGRFDRVVAQGSASCGRLELADEGQSLPASRRGPVRTSR